MGVSAFLDFLFPPICLECKGCSSTPFFCAHCWQLCAPVDSEGRCRHCFGEWEEGEICSKCRGKDRLPFTRAFVFAPFSPAWFLCQRKKECAEAIAAFMLYQWIQLDWPLPDDVLPLKGMQKVAKAFTHFLDVPYADLLRGGEDEWRCEADVLQENQTLLLLVEKAPLPTLCAATAALAETFPKRVFLLSLFSDALPHCD